MSRESKPADAKAKVPGWMVSFGDMMTLILTFFILLVSMSRERQVGLVARGIGSFIVHMRSFGLSGVLTEQQKLEIFNEVRVRFQLPPQESLDDPVDLDEAETRQTVSAKEIEELPPRESIFQPAVATFAPGEVDLPGEAQRYLELLAPSLRPGPGQLLILETELGARPDEAKSRLRSVEEHLVRAAGFDPARIETRLWMPKSGTPQLARSSVDARLVVGPTTGPR